MILVTGATGNVGRNLVTALHNAGHPVRALARNIHPRDVPDGVETIAADITDPDSLNGAFDGVESAFLFPVFGRISAFLNTAQQHQLSHLVMLSSGAVAFEEPGWIGEQHLLLERQVNASSIPAAFVRPDVFMANDLAWAPSIRQTGTVKLAYPGAATTPVDERDIAAVAAHALINRTENTSYEITGPETVTQAERVSTLADVLGHPIELVELAPEEAALNLQQSMPAEAAAFLLDSLRAKTEEPAIPNDTIQQVTGSPAHTYREWATNQLTAFGPR